MSLERLSAKRALSSLSISRTLSQPKPIHLLLWKRPNPGHSDRYLESGCFPESVKMLPPGGRQAHINRCCLFQRYGGASHQYYYYSASCLIALFCPGGVAGPPNADCYPTVPSLLCGWSDGLA